MGGKKKKGNFFNAVANTAVKGSTGGAASIDGSGWAEKVANGEEVGLEDLASSNMTGAGMVEATKLTQEQGELPEAEDPEEQKKRAEIEAKAKIAAEFTGGKGGIASTILGGSKADDTDVLKKKKLLGQ